jgi:hypothetical protein
VPDRAGLQIFEILFDEEWFATLFLTDWYAV